MNIEKLKNLKLSNRLLSLLTAGMLLVAPAVGLSENNESENSNETRIETSDRKEENARLTLESFDNNVNSAYSYLTEKINVEKLNLQCLYYLTNHEYMSDDDAKFLEENVVHGTDIANCEFQNFIDAYELINIISEYNQSVIQHDVTIDQLIDPSVLCYDELDKKIVHEAFVDYYNAYKAVLNHTSLVENEDYIKVFKTLTTLNAEERKGNNHELSVGAGFLLENTIGVPTINMQFDYMKENYPRSELDKYFDSKKLNAMQWQVRDDVSIEINCIETELELIVLQYGMLHTFAVDNVNNNLMTSFAMRCGHSK